MYGYYWVYTSAQIDLIACDQPIVVYERDKKKGSKGKEDFRNVSALEVARVTKDYNDRHKDPSETQTIDFSDFKLN